MKKAVTKYAVVAVALAGVATIAHAQPQAGDQALIAGLNAGGGASGVRVGYGYWLSPRNQIGVGIGYSESKSKSTVTSRVGTEVIKATTKSDVSTVSLGVQWKGLFAVSEKGAGFVSLGWIHNEIDTDSDTVCEVGDTYSYTAGGGYSFFVNETVTINLGLGYDETQNGGCNFNDGDELELESSGVGLIFGIEYNF